MAQSLQASGSLDREDLKMARKRHVVDLSEEERQQLLEMTCKGRRISFWPSPYRSAISTSSIWPS